MRNVVRIIRWVWGVVVLGVVGCQNPPTEPEATSADQAALYVPPPGHRIAFVGDNDQIYTIRDDGTGLTQVTDVPFPGYAPWFAQWSPAAPSRIAFRLLAAFEGGSIRYHVAVIGPNGTGFQDLTPVGVDAAWGPVWSPDGDKIAFEDETKLRLVSADGSGLTEIATNVDLVEPAWSPDGNRIVYFRYWVQLAGSLVSPGNEDRLRQSVAAS